jgi:hypothetical protein
MIGINILNAFQYMSFPGVSLMYNYLLPNVLPVPLNDTNPFLPS